MGSRKTSGLFGKGEEKFSFGFRDMSVQRTTDRVRVNGYATSPSPHLDGDGAHPAENEFARQAAESGKCIPTARLDWTELGKYAESGAAPPFIARSYRRTSQRKGSARGSATRGWRAAAPQKGRERHELLARCGAKCFLSPETEGFPICPKLALTRGNADPCLPMRQGVHAADSRARQWKHDSQAEMAQRILARLCE